MGREARTYEEFNNKYMVIKNDDQTILDPDSYFVIRSGDVAALAAIRAYSESLFILLDMDVVEKGDRIYIQDLADKVVAKAEAWMMLNRKVPD